MRQVSIAIQSSDQPKPPFAFLSHSTADNERFVVPLDQALRARGIATFFDQRDILVGQNLVDRIFDYGLGTADWVVLVLSKNTHSSPFVHKEVTAAIIRGIYGKVKGVLPVILDGVEPPIALQDVRHIVADESNIDAVADELKDAIFGRAQPAVAPTPSYVSIPVHRLYRLEPDDERVFAIVANLHLDASRWHPTVSTWDVINAARIYGMSQELVLESLAILKHEHYIAEEHYEGGTRAPISVDPSSFGLTRFLHAYRPREYGRALRSVVAAVVNGENELSPIITANDITEAFAVAILDELQSDGVLSYEMYSEGTVVTGTPMLKRLLRELDEQPAEV